MNEIVIIDNHPECSIGAPCPTIVASEHKVVLSYYTDDDTICQIIFSHCFEFKMGMPDENMIEKYPLGASGLMDYEFQKVNHSSWISAIENQYKTISEYSRDGRKYEHYIFTFHDRSFECISSGFEIKISEKNTMNESMTDAIHEI
ncbi:hypothetical protein [Aquimarina rubra]|uniref:Uncharacterized protein n=1 Tax=Aquimarina rubra TaxID=1920033 RepID=A0ABW5LEW1_9FLAO